MSNTKTTEPSAINLIAVKEGQATKLSAGAEGKISYQISISTDKKQIFIALIDSGSLGYFSREWINADHILKILEDLSQRGESFPSKVLRPVFAGRSSNNAPFLAAALLAEKLLCRDGKHESKLRVVENLADWKKATLGLKGKSIRVRLDGKAIEPNAQADTSPVETNGEAGAIEEAKNATDSPE